MAQYLIELEQILRPKQELLTPQEVNVLLNCKSKPINDFADGALTAGSVVWLATRRLRKLYRFNLSGGAAALYGLWRFGRSRDSCIDHILSLDGSLMQKELANLIVKRHQDDPRRMQLISKHFYLEKVFDDSTSDLPKLRWRYRNVFNDSVAQGQKTHDSDSHGDSHGNSYNESDTDPHSESDSKRTNLESKPNPMNPGADVMTDPLDCVFGHPAMEEEIDHAHTSSKSPRVLTRGHRRSHRRHRRHHHELPSNVQVT